MRSWARLEGALMAEWVSARDDGVVGSTSRPVKLMRSWDRLDGAVMLEWTLARDMREVGSTLAPAKLRSSAA